LLVRSLASELEAGVFQHALDPSYSVGGDVDGQGAARLVATTHEDLESLALREDGGTLFALVEALHQASDNILEDGSVILVAGSAHSYEAVEVDAFER